MGADSTLLNLQHMDESFNNTTDFSFYFGKGMDGHTNIVKAVTTNVLKNTEIDFFWMIITCIRNFWRRWILKTTLKTIDLSTFDKGVYLITIQNNMYKQCDRLVLQ